MLSQRLLFDDELHIVGFSEKVESHQQSSQEEELEVNLARVVEHMGSTTRGVSDDVECDEGMEPG